MTAIHVQHLHPADEPTIELRCRHLAVTYTAFCTDCQTWLDESISDLPVYEKS
jgi:hypothetical protein